MDNLITAIFGRSCGLNLTPFKNYMHGVAIDASTEFWSCMDTQNPVDGSPWGCHVVVSMGLIAALVITVPMGYFNLDGGSRCNTLLRCVGVCCSTLTAMCWMYHRQHRHPGWSVCPNASVLARLVHCLLVCRPHLERNMDDPCGEYNARGGFTSWRAGDHSLQFWFV